MASAGTLPPMATPRIAAGVVIRNLQGDVLLVKPTYKDGWDVPGGYVEPGESPRAAAARELKEELGLSTPLGRLVAVDWAPHEDEGDKILFLFDGGVIAGKPLGSHDDQEITKAQFWSTLLLHQALPNRLLHRVIRALADDQDIYLEHGAKPTANRPSN